MAISRRNFLALSAAAGLAPAVAGCAGPARGATDGLEYWAGFPDDAQRDYFQRKRVDAFRGSADVRLVVKPAETLGRQVQTALAAGSGPDLISTAGPAYIASYAKAGHLLPLDDYAKEYGWDKELAPWALAASRGKQGLLSLPAGYESLILLYNPATLEKHGWQPPTNRDEFEAVCAEAYGKGLIPVGAGNRDYRSATEWWVTFALNHFAGPEAVYEALQGRIPWTEPVFVDAISLLKRYFQRGWWGGSLEDYFTNRFAKMYAALASGDAAFMITGSWAFSELTPYFGEEAGNDATWDWAPLFPLRDEVPSRMWDLGIGQTLSINSRSADPDAAAEYLHFLETDSRRQAEGVADVGLQPAPVRLAEKDFPRSVDERQSRLYVELSNADTVGYTTWTFFPQETEIDLYMNYDKVCTDQLDVRSYLADVNEVFRKERSEGKVPAAMAPDGLAR